MKEIKMEINLFMPDMELFWKIVQKAFYMPLLLFVCILLSVIFLVLKRKTSLFFPLLLYSSFAFILFLIGTFVSFFESNLTFKNRIQEFVNIFFATIELFVFGIYFHRILNHKLASAIIILCTCVFIIVTLKFYFEAFDYQSPIENVITRADQAIGIELTILIFYCLSYYYALLKGTSNKILLNSPSFWITTSLLFYSLVSAPFFLIGIQILKGNPKLYEALYGIHYLFASILFLGICKACLCHQRLTN